MKKFLFAFIFSLLLIPCVNISANSVTDYEYYIYCKNRYGAFFSIVTNSFTPYSDGTYTYNKPFLYVNHTSNTDTFRMYCGNVQYSYGTGNSLDNIYWNSGNGSNGYFNTATSSIVYPYDITSNIPVFDSYVEGLKYSSGQNFDYGTIIGGYDNLISDPYTISDEHTYVNAITHFEYVFKPDTARKSFFIQWEQNYDITNSSDMRAVDVTLTYPSKSYMELVLSTYNGSASENLTGMALLSLALNEYVNGKSQEDYLGNEVTTDFIYAIDKDLSQWGANGVIGANVENIGNRKFQCTLVDSDYTINGLNIEYTSLRGGIMDTLLRYYGSEDLLTLAIPYISFDKVSMYTYNDVDKVIYNDYYIYWINRAKSNGQIIEQRSFGHPTKLNDNNVESTPDDSTGFPTTGSVIKPNQQQTDSNYNSSISDSYNNVYNNYYNDSNYSQSIIDYLNQYADGGTQENIDNAFGYVNSTVKSVSNIPTLLKNCFNSFFPPEVIKLFSALFIIFAVFCIIKIIKHIII